MIYYNTWLLSELLAQKEAEKNIEATQKLKKISPIAWRHVHIHGSYYFLNDRMEIDWQKALKEIKI